MLDFKRQKNTQKPPQKSIDGFRTQSNSIGGRQPHQNTTDLTIRKSSKDGFQPQFELDKSMSKALENKATLPMSDNTYRQSQHGSVPLKKSKLRRTFKIVGIASGTLALSLLIVGGFLFGKAWLTAHKIFQGGGSSSTLFSTDVKPETLKGEGDGRVNILLTGIGGGNRDGADLTDTIMIASIDPVAKDVTLLSLPRDLWVKVPDYWTMKINAAYSSALYRSLDNGSSESDAKEAGFATLEQTIEEHIGVPIHYHAMVNFQAFQEGVNAVGGIDVQVDEALYDPFISPNKNGLIAAQGLQHMDGFTALQFSQSRQSSSDFARGERQRQVIIALKEKILAAGTFSNPKSISSLIDALGDNVTINASLGELVRMYEITKDVPSTAIANVGLNDEPNILVRTDNVNDQSIVRPTAGISNYSEIQSFVRNTLRDPFLKSENATIAVLNGTSTPGLATTRSDELKSFGYNVIIIDDAPTKDYQTTVVYDKTGNTKKYTRNYLEKRLNAQVSEEPVSSNPILVTADFIVVLGQNEITPSKN